MEWMAIIILGGLLQGAFALPMKYTSQWRWANMWGMWSVWTLLVIPWVVGFLTIPNLCEVYRNVAPSSLGIVFLLGLIWGISAIAVGKGLDYLGLGLGFSLIMGLVLCIGSLLPILNSTLKLNTMIVLLFIGVAVMLVGICLSGWSAVLRQNDIAKLSSASATGRAYLVKGVLICLVAGITAPMLNYAFIYGDPIRVSAENLRISKAVASNGIWGIALLGGFFVNAAYCIWQLNREKVWHLFKLAGTRSYYFYTFLMGLMWAGGVVLYGMGTSNLGKLGPSIGWAVFFGIAIAFANLLGFFKGEWRGTQPKSRIIAIVGLIVLLVGIGIVGWANGVEV